ncbi:hypothetical protein [Prolixibacter sp. NT017]|uniref:hypothetical protein n=1 Tax=Prolixibacter sp. NT017 TaxID=2652390 RepID=UPI001282D2DA|nr:hypothetical protein [Prolixibacter sp. NT017]GET24232.1 hypothetical protein NT017_05610 [Prolixibacter sp. NT017]
MKAQALKSTKRVIATIMIVLTVGVTSIANAQGISAFIAMFSPAANLSSTSLEAVSDINVTAEADNSLEVENWMSNENYWTGSEQDNQLNIENWMSNENYWGVNNKEDASDSSLTIQNWMTSNSYWMGPEKESDQKLAMENWMTSNEYWGVK